ncbi:uncharacterized protein A4U43_C07F32080 [Asparagus officinalis]|uniref:Uncharacterized protein n=1 Tax=Asparagus officinalis TaxID=4686 RepID=A0A5P1EGE7_ASPOF|nr:uncharacterized protein A4U43_C07F32080 [Asparagus officinalis]
MQTRFGWVARKYLDGERVGDRASWGRWRHSPDAAPGAEDPEGGSPQAMHGPRSRRPQRQRTPLRVVELMVCELEDCPHFNVGVGSVLTSAGTVEMEA